jgi:hypothetical protein
MPAILLRTVFYYGTPLLGIEGSKVGGWQPTVGVR